MLLVRVKTDESVSVHSTFPTGISVVVMGGNVMVVSAQQRQHNDRLDSNKFSRTCCLGEVYSGRHTSTQGRY